MKYSDMNYKPLYTNKLYQDHSFRGAKLDRLFRTLLDLGLESMSWYQIAKSTSVAYGWAHRKLSELENRGVIKGSKVLKPRDLFQIWATHKVPIYVREYHVKDPQVILKNCGMEFTLTKYYAENLVNNYLFPKVYDLYIKNDELLNWHDLFSSKGYVGSGNIRVLMADEHVFWNMKKVNDWPIVCTQQLIVDLIREGIECIEAVDQLMEKYYNDQWIV